VSALAVIEGELAALYAWERSTLDATPRWQPRPEQTPPPGDWRVWLFMGGRGVGKTRAGAEWTIASARDFPLVNIIGPTADDARDIIVEGESGILACAPPDFRPRYVPTKRRLEWPNGCRSLIFTADEPERLRGKQHNRLFCDEAASWRYPEAWDQAMLGLRLGRDPRAMVATTPKPVKLIRDLRAQVATGRAVLTHGTTYDNRANLAPAFLEQIITKYEGTRMGRQELLGEYLDSVDGALWQRPMFDDRRPAPDLTRAVVALDPATTANEDSDETGIVVAGLGVDGRAYVLADRSCRASPDTWAKRAWAAYDEFRCDRVIYEANQGGDMVAHTLRTVRPTGPLTAVHASRGKRTRAEPVAALYEQGRVTHPTPLDALEDQLCSWTPDSGDSPDRLDAAVWALTHLMLGSTELNFW
jgi:predicted phage terminase large subunit-like protein